MSTTALPQLPLVSRSPVTGAVIAELPIHDEAAVQAVVAGARSEQEGWGALPVAERVRHLRRVQHELAAASGDLARTAAAETGKPLTDSMFEIGAALMMLRWARKNAGRALRPQRVATRPMVIKSAAMHYSAYGVIAVIAPWNYPVGIPFQSIPWALAAGNVVVLKPSELASATGAMIGEVIARAGRDLVRVVTGYGATGAALVEGDVDKIVFTGSGGTGRRIAAAAAKRLTPVIMELGGKDAMIVCDDADIDQAARAAVASAFSNAGQTCMATERAIVTDAAFDRFVQSVKIEAGKLTVGSADVDHVGAMTQPGQAAVINDRVEAAVRSGARIISQGERPGPAYFAPTVLIDVPIDSELWQQESFGPVMSVARVPDAAAAVALANDSEFGLNGSVFAKARRTRREVAGALVAGGVNINDALVGSGIAALPFGGERGSGYGRLQGRQAFAEFSRIKSVVDNRLPRTPSIVGAMFTGDKVKPERVERLLRRFFGAAKAGPP